MLGLSPEADRRVTLWAKSTWACTDWCPNRVVVKSLRTTSVWTTQAISFWFSLSQPSPRSAFIFCIGERWSCLLMSRGVHCATSPACLIFVVRLVIGEAGAWPQLTQRCGGSGHPLSEQKGTDAVIVRESRRAVLHYSLLFFRAETRASQKAVDASTWDRIAYLFLKLGNCLMKRLLLLAPSIRLPIVL